MTSTETTEVRELFVPSKVVSWSAQLDRAVRLAHRGLAVRLHRHGEGASCAMRAEFEEMITPNEWCVDIVLTDDGSTSSVPLVSNTAAERPKSS